MDNSVHELLNEMNVEDCVALIRKKDPAKVNMDVLQYFIDLMGCTYKLTPQDIQGDAFDLTWNVYNSRKETKIDFNNTTGFINVLVEKTFTIGYLSSYIKTCFHFLIYYAKDELVSVESYSFGVALQLLSYHLQPLATCYLDCDDSLESDAIKGILRNSIQSIMKSLSLGFNLNPKISEEIALQVTNAMEINLETIIIEEWNFLSIYKKMFKSGNNGVLLSGIESILRLFESEFVHENLITFLDALDENDESAIDILKYRSKDLMPGHLTESIIRLLQCIEDIKKESLSQELSIELGKESRLQIYKEKMLKRSITDWKNLIKLMKKSEDDFLLALIYTFEGIKASVAFMHTFANKMLLNEPNLMKRLFNIIANHIDRQDIGVYAAQLFEIAVNNQRSRDDLIVTEEFMKILKICVKNDQIFCSLLSFFLCNKNLIVQKKVMASNTFFDTLLEAFTYSGDPYLLHRIMKTFLKFVDKNHVKQIESSLSNTFDTLYETFLQDEVNEAVHNVHKSDSVTMLKMIFMIESDLIDFMDYFKYEALTIINSSRLSDVNNPMLPYYARFQKCVLQVMLNTIVDNKTKKDVMKVMLPYELEFVSISVNDLAGKLLKFISRRDMDLFEAQFVFSCLVQLLNSFQVRPTLSKSSLTPTVFYMTCPRVKAETTESIIYFAEHYVFKVKGNCNQEIEYQWNILTALTNLLKDYPSLPGLKCFSKIIRYLSSRTPFVCELERLFMTLINFKHILPTIIGLTILEIPKFDDVKEFITLIKLLLKAGNDVNCHSSIKWKVCAFLLDNMKTASNRLDLLECIKILADDINPNALLKLVKHVSCELFAASERKKLDSFLDFLSTTIIVD